MVNPYWRRVLVIMGSRDHKITRNMILASPLDGLQPVDLAALANDLDAFPGSILDGKRSQEEKTLRDLNVGDAFTTSIRAEACWSIFRVLGLSTPGRSAKT